MLPAIIAAGDFAPPLFVFKMYASFIVSSNAIGRWLQKRLQTSYQGMPHLLCGRKVEVSIRTMLSCGNTFRSTCCRSDYQRAQLIFILDGIYMPHVFYCRNVTSEQRHCVRASCTYIIKTHPLDVTVFSPFKTAMNEAVNMAVSRTESNDWDTFTFCSMLSHAYTKELTSQNINTGFWRVGLWPFDASQLLSNPRSRSAESRKTS